MAFQAQQGAAEVKEEGEAPLESGQALALGAEAAFRLGLASAREEGEVVRLLHLLKAEYHCSPQLIHQLVQKLTQVDHHTHLLPHHFPHPLTAAPERHLGGQMSEGAVVATIFDTELVGHDCQLVILDMRVYRDYAHFEQSERATSCCADLTSSSTILDFRNCALLEVVRVVEVGFLVQEAQRCQASYLQKLFSHHLCWCL